MQFGVTIDTHVNKWDLIRYAEELGYRSAGLTGSLASSSWP